MVDMLDPAILAKLPPAIVIESLVQCGSPNWSIGLRVNAIEDDKEKEYFIKIIDNGRSAEMAQGEYESQKALTMHIPEHTIPPIAWGTYQDDPSKAFYIMPYKNLRSRTPPNAQLLTILKQLHTSSQSPTGMFGFHVTTYCSASPMVNKWTHNWEEFFLREFQANLQFAFKNRGDHYDLREITSNFVALVIPRLLRPLQTDGRSIKPTLNHGDLWDGNVGIDLDTKQPVVYDACCFYGHNEMDFQCMRDPRYAIGPEFIDMYKKDVGVSDPAEDFDDRNALYSMRNDVLTAGMWPQWAHLMGRVKSEMQRLLAKYPDGYDGFKNADVTSKDGK